MNGVVQVNFLGRAGNVMFEWAHAKGYAESVGAEFQCDPWFGEKLFTLHAHGRGKYLPAGRTRSEFDVQPGETDVQFSTYAQSQAAIDRYSRADCRRWFKWRPEIAAALRDAIPAYPLVCHLRRGDYFGHGYPVVSPESYGAAVKKFGLPSEGWKAVSDDSPTPLPAGIIPATGCESWLADFWILCNAQILLRANSSFSWWAATLGSARVFSPVIEGAVGGKENLMDFCPGNHPRLASYAFTTDLHLRET